MTDAPVFFTSFDEPSGPFGPYSVSTSGYGSVTLNAYGYNPQFDGSGNLFCQPDTCSIDSAPYECLWGWYLGVSQTYQLVNSIPDVVVGYATRVAVDSRFMSREFTDLVYSGNSTHGSITAYLNSSDSDHYFTAAFESFYSDVDSTNPSGELLVVVTHEDWSSGSQVYTSVSAVIRVNWYDEHIYGVRYIDGILQAEINGDVVPGTELRVGDHTVSIDAGAYITLDTRHINLASNPRVRSFGLYELTKKPVFWSRLVGTSEVT